MKPNHSFLNIVRWVARITGTLLVIFSLVVGIGLIIDAVQNNLAPFSPYPLGKLSFMFLGIAILGLLMALWKEGLGGLISLLCLLISYVLGVFIPESDKVGMLLNVSVYAIPSFLYIVYWWMNKRKPVHNVNSGHIDLQSG